MNALGWGNSSQIGIMSVLIVYNAEMRSSKFDKFPYFQGYVKCVDNPNSKTTRRVRMFRIMPEQRISKTKALEDAKQFANKIRTEQQKFFKGRINVVLEK